MFVLAIALHAAAIATPPADPEAHARATRTTRKARTVRVRTTRVVPMRRLLPVTTSYDRNSQYRLPLGNLEPAYDPKLRVVERDSAMPCGVTGAPVCPSKGTPIVTSSVD
jgi:hypothetical protein